MELRRLVPAAFEKQGSAKLEKAEILQMTVDHLRHLHQTRDPRGFIDPLSPYANTRAFLDYRVMGFRECVAEVARYMTNVEGIDMKDPLRVRLLNHLENILAQRELGINAAAVVASTPQIGIPRVHSPPTGITIQPTPGPFIPIQRPSPDLHSPTFTDGVTIALQTPVISFATTTTVPVFRPPPIASLAPLPTANIPITTKIEQPSSPTKVMKVALSTVNNKTPFRPWADETNDD